ncbi:hypothetical protein SAMN05216338_1003284 [Bradyrhizobium sp. Rc2d]|nr:hypothetical protein SAMN05216338_1003284 [Bradyrhizobium sp. Rc2d]
MWGLSFWNGFAGKNLKGQLSSRLGSFPPVPA